MTETRRIFFSNQTLHSIYVPSIIYFYNKCILLQFPVSAITWGHNDKRLFVATGNEIHIGWVSPTIGSLQLLSRLKIHNSLRNEDQVQLLPLPCRLQNLIGMLFTQTIRVCSMNFNFNKWYLHIIWTKLFFQVTKHFLWLFWKLF